jgi:GNAT superfamily N-acetyltransferase
VRTLTPADLPALMRIKEAAGWNQTATDWHNLLDLAGETCFGLECDGGVVATTTAVCYGRRLAWIGMVLTDPAYRRRGFGRRLMEHALEALEARGVEWIKLDATEMGAPLYKDLGFADECSIERWGAIGRDGAAGRAPAGFRAGFTADWTALDLAACGADRTELLARLATMGAAEIAGEGYGMGRPGSQAAYFGPCVSRSAEAARELLTWFLAKHAGEPVYWDLLPSNTEAVRLAREFGFAPLRRLTRMARRGAPGGAALAHDDSRVFAIAGFEYG